MNYNVILANQAARGNFVSLGLDVDVSKIPDCKKGIGGKKDDANIAYDFLLEIISSTADVVQSYKPNFAFFEQFAEEGFGILEDIAKLIKKSFPGVLLIGDAKRGDIGKTNEFYMKTLMKFDAYTIAPYLGGEANKPFLFDEEQKLRDKLAFVLCQTSNKGAEEFQGLWTMDFNPAKIPPGIGAMDWMDKIKTAYLNNDILPLYQKVAKNAMTWSPNVGLVTGATYPENMKEVRKIIGEDRYLLIPGIGTQGGDLEATLDAGMTKKGKVIINVSSSALYASKGEDFAEACRKEIIKLNKQINDFREIKFKNVAESIH
jgi:orotidine 5'-phosphate decarboxylase subfamily 2